jgi:hypothetical protein
MKTVEKKPPRAPRQPQPHAAPSAPDRHFDEDDPEAVRSGSQTAQDREHTIRGADNETGPMKEFPT